MSLLFLVGDKIGLKLPLKGAFSKDSAGFVKSPKATVKYGYHEHYKCIKINGSLATVKLGCDGGEKCPITKQTNSSFQRYGTKRYNIKKSEGFN